MIKEVFKVAYARAYVRIKGANRDVTHFIIEVFLPLLGISAILFAYKALNAPNEFLAIASIGGAMIAFWFNVLWSMAAQFYWERETGNLPLYVASGVPMTGVLLGMAIGGAFNMTLRALGVLLATVFLFNIKLHVSQAVPAFLVFILTLAALYSLGMVFASSFLRFGRTVSKINELLGEPILFLSGVYFPIRLFPFVLQVIVSLIPLALGLEAVRRLLVYGSDIYSVLWAIIVLLILSFSFFVIAVKLLRYMEEQGRKTGTLTLKWE